MSELGFTIVEFTIVTQVMSRNIYTTNTYFNLMEPRAQGKHGSRLESNVILASSSASVTIKYISWSRKYNCFSGMKQECFSDDL
jgi:hypothetical protein